MMANTKTKLGPGQLTSTTMNLSSGLVMCCYKENCESEDDEADED